MPPQPLSRVCLNATVTIDPDTAIKAYPDLMLLVMSVIETWARIDAHITTLLTTFLKADFLPVAAMMQALTGGEGKKAAIRAAATESLSKENLDLFNAVMKVITPSRNRRNEFAHHFWAISPQVPDALVLIDPKHIVRDDAIRRDYAVKSTDITDMEQWEAGYKALPLSDTSHAFVYRKTDLAHEREQAKACHGYVILLGVALQFASLKDLGDQSAPVRQRLLEEPPIRLALQQMTSGNAP